jgi:hypothetical protein
MTSRKPSQRALWVVVIVLIVMTTVSLVRGYTTERGEKEDAQADKSTAQAQAATAADEGQMLAEEVLQICRSGGREAKALSTAGLCGKASTAKENLDDTIKNVPDAPAGTTTTIVRRETIPVGTIMAVVTSALNDALVASCGPDGCRDGKDSTVPGPASTIPGAKGDRGDKGDTGEKGDTPSDETLLALIRRVIADNPPQDGTDGTDGTDGRGIESLVCSSNLGPITFTLTLTDGTVQEFSCGTTPVEPDPGAGDPAE